MITIVDYGLGNLASIVNMFRFLGFEAVVTSDPDSIVKAQKLVLPGVGAFKAAMQLIAKKDLLDPLNEAVIGANTPVLGICLGMQLLLEKSEEGNCNGLGWIPGEVRKFPEFSSLKVPHMGWNNVKLETPSALTNTLEPEQRYYFVHSYYAKTDDPQHRIMSTEHGIRFDSAIARDNIFGVQFHPEKSHKFGMRILTNFAQLIC